MPSKLHYHHHSTDTFQVEITEAREEVGGQRREEGAGRLGPNRGGGDGYQVGFMPILK